MKPNLNKLKSETSKKKDKVFLKEDKVRLKLVSEKEREKYRVPSYGYIL